MFIVKNRLTVSRPSEWKHCWLLGVNQMRIMLPKSIARQIKRDTALGNNWKVEQGDSGGNPADRCSVPALQAQGSINANQKGNLTARQQLMQRQTSVVINPYNQLFSQCFVTSFVQPRQLSNVSFNRNAKAGGKGSGEGSAKTSSIAIPKEFNEQIGIYKRRWLKIRKENVTTGMDFTLMNYNVLSQELLDKHPELYRRHQRNTLGWEKRFNNLMNEVKHHNSDIVCMQEVQESHLKDYYINHMTALGYESIYKKRTGDCPDGCAIFYKWDVFKLVENINVEFHQQPNAQLLDRDNIGLIAKLAPLKNINAEFIVATTHLLYNPRRDDVRVAQIQLFLTEIERIAYNNTDYIPIILTGDFNSLPSSFPITFINRSTLNYVKLPRKHGQNQNQWIPPQLGVTDSCQHFELVMNRGTNSQTNLSREEELEITRIQHSDRKNKPAHNVVSFSRNYFNTGYLKHCFTFKSVYDHSIKGNPEATTYQDEWITVDYIFYSVKKDENGTKRDHKLALLTKYTLPTNGQLNGVTVPNDDLGSDHLSLLAKFRLVF